MRVASRCFWVVLVGLIVAAPSWGVVLDIGGVGAISTNDPPYGELGLLDGGEVATATFEYAVVYTASGADLILTVTNTSPAVTGTDSPLIPDAPVICDIFFSVPTAVDMVEYVSSGGVDAALTGWDFSYSPDGEPSSGFGFLKSVFDTGLDGGPGGDVPNPVISSIYDPLMSDNPGDPIPSPLEFVFALTFEGGVVPVGFDDTWFADPAMLGYPDFTAAAKFISGANDGSGTVTNVIPEPASVVFLLTGMMAAVAARYRGGRSRCKRG